MNADAQPNRHPTEQATRNTERRRVPTYLPHLRRNDLRLSDHEPLHAALSTQPHSLLPIYCLNHRELQPRELASAQSELGSAEGHPSQELGQAGLEGSVGVEGGSGGPSNSGGLGIPQLGPYRLRQGRGAVDVSYVKPSLGPSACP